MKNAMQKDFWREIGHTRSRFFSIMILVALSVAFLSGLKATAPDMKHTGDDYLDSLHLADIQVLSTLGLTDEDIAALRAQDKIEDAEGEYVIDAFASSDSLDAVVKVLSLTDRGISDVLLREGRMPERADECVVEENMLSLMSISIGDTITLTPGDDLSDALAQNTYTVVGTVRSPVYLAVERGTSTLGSGTVKAYLYLPREAFTLDYYTAAYVRVSGAAEMTAFYDEYDDYIDDVIDSLEDFSDARAILRHDELVDEATEKLDDAQKELDDAKAEADKELGDARRELADARKELDDGWKEYDDGKQELADSRTKLDDAKAELEDGEQEYADGVKKYDQAVRDYEKGQKDYADGVKDYEKGAQQLADGESELEAGKEKLDEGQKQLDALGNTVAGALQNDPNYAGVTGGTIIDELGRGDENTAAATDAALDKMRAQLEGGIAQAQQGLAKIDAGIEECDKGLAALEQLPDSEEVAAQRAEIAAQRSALVQQRGKVSAQLSELQSQLAALSTVSSGSIAANKQQLDQGRADYESGKQQLSAGYRDLRDGKKELDKAKKELDEAPQKIADARKELADARKELDDGWKEYYDGEEKYADGEKELADAYRELTDGEKDYREGLREYEDGKAEADEKIADAEEKIADARRKVADIESCEWYLFSRSYNPGYTGYGQDAERMANLASVFPVIFFLVAALVCLTTMTRMVEEQRVQIGSLKAMGYSGLAISRKYLLYGLLPSLTGGVFGLVIGYILFPKMIFTAYPLLAAVACTTLATLWACLATLRETPASLMRPRTPKAGKRVFLEYIKPLWRKMSFTHKVTARNLFRYQKRFWMTVIGIGGCTALIIAGFGMRSSLLFTMSRQYDDLFHYSAQVTLSSNVLPEERQAVEDFLAGDSRVVNDVPCTASSATVITSSYSTTAYVEVMEADEIGKVIDLLDCKTGEPITMEDTGVYIDQKLSELLKVSVGDTFFLDGDARGDVTVAGIYEHYTGHFIYMTPSYYEQALHADSEPNAYLMNFTSDDTDTCNAIFEKLLSMNGVVTTSRMRDTQDTYMHSMERVDFVVVIIILAAAALAMVVLFNLSNINITERQRELATIKLLGFYDGEVSAYVYRENIVLTVFGILMGCFMGHWLHIYLVRSTEIDLMMFGRQTAPSAYVYAAILTMLFSVLVNVLAHFKMKKIDMVESLKSAE